jgi:hypothetical protein
MVDTLNTMKRRIDPDSPIWIPLLINTFLLILAGCAYIYYASDMPPTDNIVKMVNTAVSPFRPMTR